MPRPLLCIPARRPCPRYPGRSTFRSVSRASCAWLQGEQVQSITAGLHCPMSSCIAGRTPGRARIHYRAANYAWSRERRDCMACQGGPPSNVDAGESSARVQARDPRAPRQKRRSLALARVVGLEDDLTCSSTLLRSLTRVFRRCGSCGIVPTRIVLFDRFRFDAQELAPLAAGAFIGLIQSPVLLMTMLNHLMQETAPLR